MFSTIAVALLATGSLPFVLGWIIWLTRRRGRNTRLPSLKEIRAVPQLHQQRGELRTRHQAAHDALIEELKH